ncbi:MAG: ClpXP protease specificity-enhancing factor [Pseudomonadota bacterium]|nr:ClpXP protease specificity-enhancing factor [Pseudomonadota bacterium]
MSQKMTSQKPYLIRGLYDWIVDNGLTPHILVDCTHPNVQVPQSGVQDGKIVLNLSPGAVRALELGNDEFSCQARFSGAPFDIHVPASAVLAIYARENGQGMMFREEDGSGDDGSDPGGNPPDGSGQKPHLSVVK